MDSKFDLFQIIKLSDDGNGGDVYSGVIGDFACGHGCTLASGQAHPSSVFCRRNAITNWKPVLLVSQQHVKLFAYLIFKRLADGEWTVEARAYAPEEAREEYRVSFKQSTTVRSRDSCHMFVIRSRSRKEAAFSYISVLSGFY